jgi:hypothetical protein
MPPFAAKTITLDGHEIVVVRVEDSNQTPHLLTATGSIVVREPGGKKPIASQARLLELCVRPKQAEAEAVRRMTTLPLVVQALAPRPAGEPVDEQRIGVSDWMLVVSPLTVPEGFHARGLSEATVRKMRDAVLAQVRHLGPEAQAGISSERPFATGVAIEGLNASSGDSAELLLDAGGVVVGQMRRRLVRGSSWHVGATADEVIRPLLDLTLAVLGDCGVVGRTEVHLHVRITPTAMDARPVLAVYTAHTIGELAAPAGQEAFYGGHIDLPLEGEATKDLAEQLMRQLARTAGIDWWER